MCANILSFLTPAVVAVAVGFLLRASPSPYVLYFHAICLAPNPNDFHELDRRHPTSTKSACLIAPMLSGKVRFDALPGAVQYQKRPQWSFQAKQKVILHRPKLTPVRGCDCGCTVVCAEVAARNAGYLNP